LPLAIAGTALAAAAGGNAGTNATHKLVGEVGPGYKIEVTTPADKDVKTTKAGTYVIHVEDRSTAHNFHLTGPGLNKSTSVVFEEPELRVDLELEAVRRAGGVPPRLVALGLPVAEDE